MMKAAVSRTALMGASHSGQKGYTEECKGEGGGERERKRERERERERENQIECGTTTIIVTKEGTCRR